MATPGIILAGTHSGSGKTTVTLAVLAALTRRGRCVQAFKVGPDFIDPGHHTAVTGRTSRNLDTWLLDESALAATYRKATLGSDFAVVEGVMGLFDGRSATDEAGSTADLARALDLPVVLVVDAGGMSRSIAPLVQGFAAFDERVRVVGAIADRVGSARHYDEYLAPALEAVRGVEPLGYLLRDRQLTIPSRHLGLWTAHDHGIGPDYLEALANAAESTINMNRLIELCGPPSLAVAATKGQVATASRKRVAVARDAAFCFYYEDNLDTLRDAGAEVVPFSPLADPELPAKVDCVYLGGGYPELHAQRLAENGAIRAAIRRFHADGGTIFAECGGMMACCRELADAESRVFGMWDLIPARVHMRSRFTALGYVTMVADKPIILGPQGTEVRGHEFHYSELEPLSPLPYGTRLLRHDRAPKRDGIHIGRLLAGYAHLHFGSNPEVARSLLGG
jgi:cobyrinic acid a,c-diamide synthase